MKTITISQIQSIVCDYYHILVEATQTKSRKRELVQARQVTMYFTRKKTKESLHDIGLEVAARDHATVLYACKTVNNLIDTDRSFKYDIYRINKEIINLEKKLIDEPEIRDIEIADLYDFFPHPGSYPEIEPAIVPVKFIRPKLYSIKFRRFESEVIKPQVSVELVKHFVFPYAGIASYTNCGYHGFKEHSL
jgi:hypothetical protein